MRRVMTDGAFGSRFVQRGISRQPHDYTTGDFVTGLCNLTRSCSPPGPLSVSIEGGLHAITFSTGPLMEASNCPGELVGRCYNFTGGSVSVLTSLGGQIIFSDSLIGGLVNQDGNSFTILADLTPGVRGGMTAAYTLGPVDQDVQRLSDGAATVNFVSTVRERGTLGMLGTGLAAMARRIVFSLYCLYVKILVADYD